MLRIVVTLSVGLAFAAPCTGAWAQAQRPYNGKQVYESLCIVCHGLDGKGSPIGGNLAASKVKSKTDAELVTSIAKGRPNTEMGAFEEGLTEDEIFLVMLYVRGLQGDPRGDVDASTLPDMPTLSEQARRGEAVFAGKAGCIRCHRYSAKGSVIGPDLRGIGSRLRGGALRKAVADPSDFIAPEFWAKEVRMGNGEWLRARFRNESAETIELLVQDGEVWTTYLKAELGGVRDARGSLMPDRLLDDLSEEERSDLFAFLESLE